MAKSRVQGFCVYCGVNPATEREHVLAKQFFPPEHRYRGNLVKVPACGICNRKKQEAEDSPGIFFQLSDATPASEAVLEKRALRTFKRNERLRRVFQQGLNWHWVSLESGLIVRRLGIQFSQQDLYYINEWYKYLTKGFYYHELGKYLPNDHLIYIIKPIDFIQFCFYRDYILGSDSYRRRSLADSEFKYIMASNNKDGFSIWMFFFRAVEMCAVTASPELPSDFHAVLLRNAWNERNPKSYR